MSGVVLAFIEHPDAAPDLLAASERAAALMGGARIEAMVVRTSPAATIIPSEEILTREREGRIRAQEQSRVQAAKVAFESWLGGRPGDLFQAQWIDIEGIADVIIRERGSRADIIVLQRPLRNTLLISMLAMKAALFGTGRPILVVPRGAVADFGHRVAIAWHGDRHAVRAVLSALRCSIPPERVFLLTGLGEGENTTAVPDILVEHDVRAELHTVRSGHGGLGEALLAAAHRLGADMLVMGAYAHSPLREMVLGGVTHFMLEAADIPVLMRH